MPLAAHFACPARPQPQFAATPPFDIARFLAQCGQEVCGAADDEEEAEVAAGFMDVLLRPQPDAERARWRPLAWARARGGGGGAAQRRRLLAVACNGSLCWYAVGADAGPCRRVLARQLRGALVLAAPHRPAGRIGISTSEGVVEADLGAADVAHAWARVLEAQAQASAGGQRRGPAARSPGSATAGKWLGDPAS
ncbi:hypothetical protein IWQ56_001348 [Coemansia nantahalensis]|nr:hypothetical protein IWQ56_001348 [Coemansia nantahalensis]